MQWMILVYSLIKIKIMEINNIDDFKKNIKKVNQTRRHSIRNSVGALAGFNFHNKNSDDKVSFNKYSLIVDTINNEIIEYIIKNGSFQLPFRFGKIEVEKNSAKCWIDKDGNLKTNRRVDMNSTLELWHEDESSRLSKKLLFFDDDYIFRIRYRKHYIGFKNSGYYSFRFCRTFKMRLKDEIKTNINYDTYERKKVNIT